MSVLVLILASGEAVRFDGQLKQLLPLIDGQTIIGRIAAQVTSYSYSRPIVVSHHPVLQAMFACMTPTNHDTVCDTLLDTSENWFDRNIILLGDVIYANAVMRDILSNEDPIAVFGNTWEIFALAFDLSEKDKIVDALNVGRLHRLGKLRYFYRALCGVPLDYDEREGYSPDKNYFKYVGEWTRDIDTQYEYDRAMTEIVWAGKLNE